MYSFWESHPGATARSFRGQLTYVGCVAVLFVSTATAQTENNAAGAWRLLTDVPSIRMQETAARLEDGSSFTRFQLSAASDFQAAELISRQRPALAIEDFRAAVRLNSTQKGLRLALRMVFPNQPDPRTRKPLTTYLPGETYDTPEVWQTLTVATGKDVIDAKVRQLRAELKEPSVNTKDAYFDACVLLTELHRGPAFVDIGDTQYGPVVAPPSVVHSDWQDSGVRNPVSVRIDREQLFVGSQAVFLRFLPDHGESAKLLSQIGVNGAWVSDVHTQSRMKEFSDNGILVLATPPHPEFDPGDFSAPVQGLPPLEQSVPDPAIWYLGTRVTTDQMDHLLGWAREVRSADRIRRRPLMADVEGSTDVASRQVDFVGLSRHKIGGRLSFGKVRNLSFIRQNATAQLAFPWEWIQTEPSADVKAWRSRTGSLPIHVEPEQIVMQLAACLSAGARGIGFWKTASLQENDPGTEELRRAIELACVYAQIVEPLLVQGRVDRHIPIKTSTSAPGDPNSVFRQQPVTYTHEPSSPDGAVISNAGTSLILAGYWDTESQFVPQKLYAPQATLTVAATETASAWQVTATGIRGLRRQPTAGGLYLKINNFDQLAVILVSSNPETRRLVEQRVYQHSARAAKLLTELSELKLTRVRRTCDQISQYTESDSAAERLFRQAGDASQSARSALEGKEFPAAEHSAKTAMRLTREIQNRYWYRAIQSLPSPTASPHTAGFSTLPDHWSMMQRISDSVASENLIPSGNFDSLRLLSQGTWKPVSPRPDAYHASTDIVSSQLALRMRAWPRNSERVASDGKPSLLLSAPAIAAEKGDVFIISGRVKFGQSVPPDSWTPFMIFDSDLGPEMAVSPKLEPSWRTFRMYRQASATGPFKIWLALRGAAEVFVDDFSVVRHRPVSAAPPAPLAVQRRSDTLSSGASGSRVQGAGYSNPEIP